MRYLALATNYDGTLATNGVVSDARVRALEKFYAWKDTVKSLPGTLTRVIAKFDLPSKTEVVAGKSYRYVGHCHILAHEDNKMMRPYDVIG